MLVVTKHTPFVFKKNIRLIGSLYEDDQQKYANFTVQIYVTFMGAGNYNKIGISSTTFVKYFNVDVVKDLQSILSCLRLSEHQSNN